MIVQGIALLIDILLVLLYSKKSEKIITVLFLKYSGMLGK